ncbi:unnamed protein product [Meloidogyne enterolobii]|uniref:Uncharacterized protein n=1 Tax=Meloidogyne enterolobii TaxID=390850 RepID=A0ACB0ZL35_MELEN
MSFFFNSKKIYLITIFVIFLSTFLYFEEIQACIADKPGYERKCDPKRKAFDCCKGKCTKESGWKCVGGLEEEKTEDITESSPTDK